MKNKYNWSEIQKYYDEGNSWRECSRKFGFTLTALQKARKRNEIKSRSLSESVKLSIKKHGPTRHTEETKLKISNTKKESYKKDPSKIPVWKPQNSYPEIYFKNFFEKENIDLKYHLQVGTYQLDFYNLEKGICVEIDGEQHYRPEDIKKDKIRDEFLKSKGWKIYRIRWAHYKKLSFDEKKELINKLKEVFENYKHDVDLSISFRKNLIEKECLQCKNKFEVVFISRKQKFCNIKCSNIYKEGFRNSGKNCFGKAVETLRPPKEELEKIIWTKPTTHIAKEYGVSDKAVEKWVKKYGLTKPPKGYWTKLKYNKIKPRDTSGDVVSLSS